MEIKKKVEAIVGAQYILSEQEPLESYSKDYSFCPPRKPTYVVQPMDVREIQEKLNLELTAGEGGLDREVTGGYCGDLLSDVMANSTKGDVWITIQSHKNILAVAVLRELAAVILVNNHIPDDETKAKADLEGMPILLSPFPTYQLAGRLFEAGIGKKLE